MRLWALKVQWVGVGCRVSGGVAGVACDGISAHGWSPEEESRLPFSAYLQLPEFERMVCHHQETQKPNPPPPPPTRSS